MRILYLTAWFPYPPDSGGTIKTLSILEYLRRRHELTVLCLRRSGLTDKQSRWAEEWGDIRSVPLNRGRNLLSLARSYLSGLPLSVERSRAKPMTEAVSEAMRATSFNAIFIDGWLMAQYLPQDFLGRKLLHEHNAEHIIWQRHNELDQNFLRRRLVRLEARRVQGYEASILGPFDAVFAVSQTDCQALICIGADSERIRLLPNLPDPSLLEMPPLAATDREPAILYFGTLSWQPNIEGLDYFLRSVWPLVRERMPQARFVIAGTGAPALLARLARATDGVDFLGPVEDAEPLYRDARLFVETTHSGGGTKLKILNALARGLPVVATRQAVEGIEASPGEHLLTGDSPQSLAEAAVRLMSDADLWQWLSDAGRALIRKRYVAEVAYTPLDEALAATSARA